MVIIGNAGAENGVRGYISAYDAETGKMAWRTYTVPGDPSKGFESKAMETASKTWHGEYWKTGGGGAPWEGIVYDPALDLLYFGTGNATAWYRALRGGGDSLYTASIMAVHASNGELAWYFQTTPGENWDYDATQPLMQADLTIGGRARKVIMQANKNGFFYVLDRETGEFISGAPFVSGVTWATGLDPKTGRPIESPGVAELKPVIVSPEPGRRAQLEPHGVQSRDRACLPGDESGYAIPARARSEMEIRFRTQQSRSRRGVRWSAQCEADHMPPATGELVAWDPVAQKAAWRVKNPTVEDGGVLATGGNLVFQGRGDGTLVAYRATDGKELWTFDAGTGIMAPPVTYTVDGTAVSDVDGGMGRSAGIVQCSRSEGQSSLAMDGFSRSPRMARDIESAAVSGTKSRPCRRSRPMPRRKPCTRATCFSTRTARPCHGINAVAGPTPISATRAKRLTGFREHRTGRGARLGRDAFLQEHS